MADIVWVYVKATDGNFYGSSEYGIQSNQRCLTSGPAAETWVIPSRAQWLHLRADSLLCRGCLASLDGNSIARCPRPAPHPAPHSSERR